MKEILDLAKLPIPPDERSLEPRRLERTAGPGDDPQRPPERRQTLLALQLVRSGIGVDDRLLGGTPGRVADVDRARIGQTFIA